MTKLPVGEQELTILKDLLERGPGSVGELHARYGEPRGLARSTVLTMMERLRGKGYLTRRREEGVYRYHPRGGEEVLSGLVGRFVERALGGSVSPFVAYLSDRERISDHELRELEQLVGRLRSKRRERKP
jgi:predicted transcriptional regulator